MASRRIVSSGTSGHAGGDTAGGRSRIPAEDGDAGQRWAGRGRVVSSKGESADSARQSGGKARRVAASASMTARASGRAVTSQSAVSRTATSKSATSRSVKSPVRSVVSRKASSRTHPERSTHGRTGRDVQSQAQGFVDARALRSDDVLGRTLSENVGPLGVATRPKVLDFDARLKERRKAGSKVVALRLLIVALVCAAIGGLVWLLLFSTVFRLERADISISGVNEWISRSEVMDIASQQSGKSLFLVSTDDIATKLKNIPGVTQAEAVKRYPRSLSVTVKAQQPAAMLKEPDGTLVAVDRKARVLNAVGKASTKGIPVIEVSSVSKGLNSRAVKEALNILGGLPDTMRNTITKVSAKTQDSITTELDSGAIVVVWGDSSQLELKSAIVDKLINDKSALGGKHQIDVSAPSRPIIK